MKALARIDLFVDEQVDTGLVVGGGGRWRADAARALSAVREQMAGLRDVVSTRGRLTAHQTRVAVAIRP